MSKLEKIKPIDGLNMVKSRLLIGLITYEEAAEEAKPYIKEFNRVAFEKAKVHNVRPRYLTWAAFLR